MLYDWQKPEADHLVKVLGRHNVALEASDTGTGKTYIVCQAIKEIGLKPFVIAPKSVLTTWRKTLELFGLEALEIINIQKLKTGKTKWLAKKGRGKLITDWEWHLPANTILVWDEAHEAGGTDSQNSKLLALLKVYKVPVLCLSATIADSPLRLRALGYLFGFFNYNAYLTWARNNGCWPSRYARGQLEFPKGKSRIQHLKRLHGAIFPEFGGRLRIDDIEGFPECSLQADEYDLDECKEVQAAYDELEDKLHTPENKEPALVLLMRARENVELLKVPLFEKLIADLLDEGHSVVAFYSFRRPAETLMHRLGEAGIPARFIYGGQKQEERDKTIAAFQSDGINVLVVMIQAGGQSISLHDLIGNRPRTSLINPPYAIVQLKQALGRIWRAGAKTKAVQKIIFAANTVEEKACEAIRRKLGNMNLLNDGDLVAGLSITKENKPNAKNDTSADTAPSDQGGT